MTATQLYATLKFIIALDKKLVLQNSLEAIRESLNNLVSSPAQPQHQSALASALETFTSATAKLGQEITPSQAAIIAELGGHDFFDPTMGDRVRTSIEKNAMTPSVARDFLQDLASRRSGFLEVVRSSIKGLGQLQIKETELQAGGSRSCFPCPARNFQESFGCVRKGIGIHQPPDAAH